MSKEFWDRWAPATGIAAVILLIVSTAIVGDFPKAGDPAEEFAAFYRDERGKILASVIILAFALSAFLWFVATVAARVRDAGEDRLAAAVLGSGGVFAALLLVSWGVPAGIAHASAQELDPELIKAFDRAATGVGVLDSVPLAVFALAFGIAALRRALLARWIGYATIAVAVVVFLSATTWAREGFWSPYGTYGLLEILVFAVWAVVASALLIARPPEPRTEPTASPG